jgi:hypothetical protein
MRPGCIAGGSGRSWPGRGVPSHLAGRAYHPAFVEVDDEVGQGEAGVPARLPGAVVRHRPDHGDLLARGGVQVAEGDVAVTNKRSAQQQQRNHPVRVCQAEPARQIGAVGVPDRHGLGRAPCIQQFGEIVDMPSKAMLALPLGSACAALVVTVYRRKVRDHGGNIAQIVR